MSRKRKKAKRRREKQRRAYQRAKPSASPRVSLVLSAPPWIADERELCPCGSGAPFADCCKAHIPIGGRSVDSFPPDDPKAGELAWRGALTKYLGNVFRHTLPILHVGEQFDDLVKIDIEAISDCVDRVAIGLKFQERADEALKVFDHISAVVPLPGLTDRMLATKAVWFDAVLDDPEGAKRLLADVDPMIATDSALLEAYVSIIEPPPTQRIQILERAIEFGRDPDARLFDATSKAMYLLVSDDSEGAARTITSALAEYDEPEIASATSAQSLFLARAYSIGWRIAGNQDDLAMAIRWFDSIELDQLSDFGKADVHFQTGALLVDSGDFTEGAMRLEHALELEPAQPTRIRLAECLARDNRITEARELLEPLALESVDTPLQVEYLTIQAMFAVQDQDEQALRAHIKALQAVHVEMLFFREQRNRLCMQLLELLDQESANWTKPGPATKVLRVLAKLASFSRYLHLKPNVFGVGINLNKIIDDAALEEPRDE